MFLGNKKCRIYAACGVSQTPITNLLYEEDLYANVFIEQNNPTKYSIELFQESR